jgi:uncharacterized protein with HEPN domain
MKSDLPLLGHIADSIAAVESYTAAGRDAFLADRLTQDAVIRNFEIIGEAASRLSATIRNRPGIPWRKIIAFRNRLIPRLLERRSTPCMECNRKRPATAQSRG